MLRSSSLPQSSLFIPKRDFYKELFRQKKSYAGKKKLLSLTSGEGESSCNRRDSYAETHSISRASA